MSQLEKEVKTAEVPKVLKGKKGKLSASLAGAMSFHASSTSPKALEKTFNAAKPLTLEIASGKFQKGENALLDSLEWKTGEYNYKKGNRFVYIWSKALIAPAAKSLEEGKGQIISDYQNFLEKEWIAALRKKYPVTLNEDEFKKLIKK